MPTVIYYPDMADMSVFIKLFHISFLFPSIIIVCTLETQILRQFVLLPNIYSCNICLSLNHELQTMDLW